MSFIDCVLKRYRWWWWLPLPIVVVGVVVTWLVIANSPARRLRQAEVAIAEGRFADAERFTQMVLSRERDSSRGLLLAGQAAAGLGRIDEAQRLFLQIPETKSKKTADALFQVAEQMARRGHAADADALFLRVLRNDPEHDQAIPRRADLLRVCGRRWEAVQQMLPMVQSRSILISDLVHLGHEELIDDNDVAFLELFRATAPDDPYPLLGLAWLAVHRGQHDEARKLLHRVLARDPESTEALALLGRLLLDATDPDAFLQWHARLPEAADRHPDVWMARGLWARDHAENRCAIYCFWQALRIHPNHLVATEQIGLLLTAEGQPAWAERFKARGRQLSQLRQVSGELFQIHEPPPNALRTAAQLCEALGCLKEAMAWAAVSMREFHESGWTQTMVKSYMSKVRSDSPRVDPAYDLAQHVDFSDYPRPAWKPRSE